MKWISYLLCLLLVVAAGCGVSTQTHPPAKEDHGAEPVEPSTMVGESEKADGQAAGASGVTQSVCPVSGEELGSMSEPITVTHAGQTVQLCCKGCVKKFNADPERYLAKLNSPNADHEASDHNDHQHEQE